MRRYLAIILPLATVSLLLVTIAILLVVLSFPFFSCNKSNSPATPPSTVSANINGTPTMFNAIITVDSLSTPGTVYIVAHTDSANLTPLLEITLSNTPLKTMTYPYTDSTGGPLGLLGYTLWKGGTAVQYPDVTDTVILTAANRNWISGTFQGTCAYSPDSVVSITNGQFTVSYPQH